MCLLNLSPPLHASREQAAANSLPVFAARSLARARLKSRRVPSIISQFGAASQPSGRRELFAAPKQYDSSSKGGVARPKQPLSSAAAAASLQRELHCEPLFRCWLRSGNKWSR